MTAILGGLGITTGGAISTGLNGGSTSDVLSLYDQYFAGMSDALTFGSSTQFRRWIYGETAVKDHQGVFFNLGRFGGGVLSAWIGANAPALGQLGRASGLEKVIFAYDLLGTGVGIAQSRQNFMEGRATLWDVLPFLPLLAWEANSALTIKGLGSGAGDLKFKKLEVEYSSGGSQPYVLDLSHVTGKTAKARNRAIRAIIAEDFPNLKLTHTPVYSPFLSSGIASPPSKLNPGVHIGKNNFSSRSDLRNVIIHEELHHRWWKRGIPSYHHSPDKYIAFLKMMRYSNNNG